MASIDELVGGAGGGGEAGGQGGAGGGGGHPLQGQPAPAIDLAMMDGGEFKLSELPADEVIILDFWATWCPPCREGLPHLQAVADWAEAEGKPVKVFAVNVQETPAEAKAYWQQEGLTLPVVMDARGQASQAYGVTGIPQTVLIHNGQVKGVHVGFNPQMQSQLKREIEAILSEGQS